MSIERVPDDDAAAAVKYADSGRMSVDDTASLNDDLIAESAYSSDSNLSPSTKPTPYRHSSSRNSIDNNSLALSSAFFSLFRNNDDIVDSSNSPLGPNGIHELTIGSDTARIKLNRLLKNSVALHGGSVTVPNIRVPSIKDIPQILLLKLKKKVPNNELEHRYVTDYLQEYAQFESGQKKLTEDTLSRFLKEEQKALSGEKEQVPLVFLQDDFRLDDPRVFQKVFENLSILPNDDQISCDSGSTTTLANNTDIQEKLSLYLDTVEIDLIDEISESSESFFSAIGNVQSIQSQSVKCAEKFQEIHDKVIGMADGKAQLGREILRKVIQYKNIEYLESTMVQLQYVMTMHKSAITSLDMQLYAQCLEKIRYTENLIAGRDRESLPDSQQRAEYPNLHYPLADLTRLPALVNMRNDLGVLKDKAGRGYVAEFHDFLLLDLRQYYKSCPTDNSLARMYCSIAKSAKKVPDNSFQVLSSDFRAQLAVYVAALYDSGLLIRAYAAYEGKVITEVKDIIKNNLPNKNGAYMDSLSSLDVNLPRSSSPSILSEKSGQLGLNLSGLLKQMSPPEFENVLKRIYTQLSECLRRLTSQQKVLLDLALVTTQDLPRHLQIDIMRLDISSAIHKAIELTQVRLTRVLNVRLEQTADLLPRQYLRLYALSSAYSQDCEIIDPGHVMSGSGTNPLGEWLKQHVAYFTHRYHHNASKTIAHSCDHEVWKEVTLSQTLAKCQSQITQIVEYSDHFSSGGEKGSAKDEWLLAFDFTKDTDQDPNNVTLVDESCKSLTLEQQLFIIPPLAITLVNHVLDILVISKAFPSSANTVQTNLLNYFKLINTKVFQAVLNAGATRTAGLKHIFPKHIALCIQFVEFSLALLEKVSCAFNAGAASSILNSDIEYTDELTFSSIIANFKDHENKLFSKLVSIVHDRTVLHCTKIVKIDWHAPLPDATQCHEYMEALVRETITVSKSLLKYLPDSTSTLILLQIFDNYKRLLVECYCTQLPQFEDFNEKYTVLKDIDYFRVKLCDIPGYGNSGQVLWENVNALPTLEDARMEQVMKLNIEDELQERGSSIDSTRDVCPAKDDTPQPENAESSLQGTHTPVEADDNNDSQSAPETPNTRPITEPEHTLEGQSVPTVEAASTSLHTETLLDGPTVLVGTITESVDNTIVDQTAPIDNDAIASTESQTVPTNIITPPIDIETSRSDENDVADGNIQTADTTSTERPSVSAESSQVPETIPTNEPTTDPENDLIPEDIPTDIPTVSVEPDPAPEKTPTK